MPAREFSIAFLLHILAVFCTISANAQDTGLSKPNVLFICIDDLRPELSSYGADYIKSPNIDRLASQGFTFTKHFVTVPTCGASRHSMLTGELPDQREDIRNSATEEALTGQPEQPRPETFVHHLRRNGYYTVGIGKITHHPDGRVYEYLDPVSNVAELPHSWDELPFDYGKWGTGHHAFFGYADGSNRNTLNKKVKPYESADVDDEGYPDGVIARVAINKLRELKERDEPFFLGVGFYKPHLPFNAPQKYWDMYQREHIPVAPYKDIPANIHRASLHGSGEFNQYKLGEEKASLEHSVSDEYARKLGHAYAACVSYVDAQVGKLLQELDELGLAENTVVVIWGDHGWHLGDHRVWGKHTLYDRALRSAFLMKVPGQPAGVAIDKVVSSIDIYPTLMAACNVPMPYDTRGRSLLPLMRDGASDWQEAAYSYFNDGYSMRTGEYRITRYYREEQPVMELYDHKADPDETINLASKEKKAIKRLMPLMEHGYTGVYD